MVDLRESFKQLRIPIRFAMSTILPKRHTREFTWLGTEVGMKRLPVTVQFSLQFTEDAMRRLNMPAANEIRSSLGHMRW